ncbi:DUF6053 domain-containing protein [Lysobacter enzymogenes]|uniref:DUF6053 domain-containing protein n=1 Tax=Lysobacter enzymogenes TaxID=69 RepID=UPI0037486BE4
MGGPSGPTLFAQVAAVAASQRQFISRPHRARRRPAAATIRFRSGSTAPETARPRPRACAARRAGAPSGRAGGRGRRRSALPVRCSAGRTGRTWDGSAASAVRR